MKKITTHLHYMQVCCASLLRQPLNASLFLLFCFTIFVTFASQASADTIIWDNIATSTTWTTASSTYVVMGHISIEPGATLTIEPGVIVKFEDSVGLIVYGELDAVGTESDPIYFTSIHDDEKGGDTNSNGTSTISAMGDWENILVETGGYVNLEHVVVRYGGDYVYSGTSGDANFFNRGGVLNIADSVIEYGINGLQLHGGTTTITDSVIRESGGSGLNINDGSPHVSINSSTFSNNNYYGITITSDGGHLTFNDSNFTGNGMATVAINANADIFHSGNTATNNGVNGIEMTYTVMNNETWTADTLPYFIISAAIDNGATVTVEPGAVLKFSSSNGFLSVSGTLNIEGSALYPVYLTSDKDDSIGGDTNNDSSSTYPAAGDWGNVLVDSGGTVNLTHTIVRYGGKSGYGSMYGNSNLYNKGGTLIIGTSTISNADIYGIHHQGGTTVVAGSVFYDNGVFSAYSTVAATSSFSATNNYWDSFSGPYHSSLNPSGGGDEVSDYISFVPWLGNQHYTFLETGHATSSVDQANKELLWKWATSTQSQIYESQLEAAVDEWNDLNVINIQYTSGVADVEVMEVNLPEASWSGGYNSSTSGNPGEVLLNVGRIGNEPLDRVQKTWTHELGHALGLDHSYWSNIMFPYRTTQTTVGDQDIEDYHYLWGY